MQQVGDRVVGVGQWIRRYKVDEISSVLVVMAIHRACRSALGDLDKVMGGLARSYPGLGIGALAIEHGHILALGFHLRVLGHSSPCLVDAHNHEGWLGHCDHSGLLGVGRQGHLETVGDDLGRSLTTTGAFKLLHEAHGIEDKLEAQQFVPRRELSPEHARLDTLRKGSTNDGVPGAKDEGTHQHVVREKHVVLVDVVGATYFGRLAARLRRRRGVVPNDGGLGGSG
mmetsp:Transcript_15371/g.44476  ORF Transcript_15371/g.44476 Transcript_15371/m.44476 type:complete len:227 (+) Transcript_15371:234-914(+)